MTNMTETMTVAETYDAIRATDTSSTWMESHAELIGLYPYNAPENAQSFDNIDAMRRAVNDSGSHYFDADAIRFFRGKTDGHLYGGRFWVESRKYVNNMTGESDAREYQVAWVARYQDSLSIEKLGSFRTLDAARSAARSLASAVAGSELGEVDES